MGIEEEKAENFIERLWDNPSLSGLSPLQKEEQIRQFLEVNAEALIPSMAAPAFFPNLSWIQVKALLENSLNHLANKAFERYIQNILNNCLDLSFMHDMTKIHFTASSVRENLYDYLMKLASMPGSRRELIGPLIGIETGFVDRYVAEILRIQEYIRLELFKIERLTVSEEKIADFLKTIMLIRASVHYISRQNIEGIHISPKFAKKAQIDIARNATFISEDIITSAVNSYLVSQDNPEMRATSGLVAIFSHRCRNLNSHLQKIRGAETSDKSWFNVARRNYKYFGFDLSMLTELQFIASGNGW